MLYWKRNAIASTSQSEIKNPEPKRFRIQEFIFMLAEELFNSPFFIWSATHFKNQFSALVYLDSRKNSPDNWLPV